VHTVFTLPKFILLVYALTISFCQPVLADDIKLKNGWVFSRVIDKMTDENTSFISKVSNDGTGLLAYKCYGFGQYYPVWGIGIFVSSRTTFRYRFDKNKSVDISSGIIDGNGKMLHLIKHDEFRPAALSSKMLILNARSDVGDSVLHEFDLLGLKDALDYANRVAPCK